MISIKLDRGKNQSICELDGDLVQIMTEFSAAAIMVYDGLREHDRLTGEIFEKWLTMDIEGSFIYQMRKTLGKARDTKDGVTIQIDAEELRKQRAEEDQDGD